VSAGEFTAPAPADASPVEYASFSRRLGAALLDSLVWIIAIGFFNPVGGSNNETAAAIYGLVVLSAWFNYFAFCEWRWGQTIGKNATGIRVLPLEGGKMTWQAAAVRNLLRLVDFPLALVGVDYLIVRGSPRRQRLGDRAAKTIVVREQGEAESRERDAKRAQVQPMTGGPSTPPPYGTAPASEIFGEASEALAQHPGAGAGPEPAGALREARSPAAASPPDVPVPRRNAAVSTSSWTASGFPYATWDVRRTLLGLLIGLLVGGLFAPLLVVPFDPDLDSTGALLAAQTLLTVTLICVAVGVASGEGKIEVHRDLAVPGLRGPLPSAFGWMALALFSYYVFAVLYGTLIIEPDQEDIARDLGLDAGVLAAIPVVLLIAVAAPIAEEIFFRGMLFGGLRRRLSTLPAAAISALVFGALHAATGITAVPPLIAFGFVLALLYERTGSLAPCIAAHALNNALALAVTA
jgi:membrane protease YdiL (CAAX protease family)/uncharacterized RDD family membrane protein YckC